MKISILSLVLLVGTSITFAQEKQTTPIKPVAPQPKASQVGPPKPKPIPPEKGPAKPVQAEPIPEQTTPTAPEKKEPETYVIKTGDNPWSIAKAHGVELAELMKVNEIKDAKNLKIGDTLILPAGVKSKNKPSAPEKKDPPKKEVTVSEPAPKDGDDWAWHTVQKGENPWTIAKKLKVDHQKIIGLNEGVDFRTLSIGQKIKVPKK